jgi:hypothetical protein
MYDHPEGINYNYEIASQCDLIIGHEPKRLEPSDFEGYINKDEILSDEALVKKIYSGFVYNKDKYYSESEISRSSDSKKISDTVETLLGSQSYLQNWFGEPLTFIRTTEYDDLVHGTDFVAEYEINGKKIYLAIDNTTSCNDTDVTNKFKRNIERLLTSGACIKYFESSEDGSKKSITDAIPLVIGVDPNNAKEMISRYAQIIKFSQKNDKSDLSRKTLATLKRQFALIPAQMVFLDEMEKQLVMYREILTSKNSKKYSDKFNQINNMIQIISQVKSDKEGISIEDWNKDGVLSQISYACERYTPKTNNTSTPKIGPSF